MCGISGIISSQNIIAKAIAASLQAIKHRGPDDSLIFEGKQFFSTDFSDIYSKQNHPNIAKSNLSNSWFGFNRLSIVDVSPAAMQPFYEADNQIVFMMNGEVYNYEILRKTFLANEIFTSLSDSEVVFKLYQKLGDDFIQHLQGMFTIVLYHFKEKKLKVWRDRLGIKPFYYSFHQGNFIFSSEMKGIFATELISKQIDYQGLAYSMYLATCPSPKTIYQNIQSLQAAHYLEFSVETQQINIKPYWKLQYFPAKKSIQKFEFQKDIQTLCELYKTGDVEKALMLSGGIDSGTLAYYFGKIFPDIKAIHISDLQQTETQFAQLNAENANVNCINFTIEKPTKEQFLHYLTSEEEPNTSPEPAYFLSEKAQKLGVKVLYNALGPDEIFGGYVYFQKVEKWKFIQPILSIIPSFIIPKKHQSKFKELQQFGFAFYPMFSRRLFSWEEINDFLQEHNQEIPVHPLAYISQQINELYPEFHKLPILKKISYVDIFYYISSHHSFRSDQPSMKFGIEMRFPFLEHTFVEKYFNQTQIFNNINQKLKPFFRENIADILPSNVLNMSKKGFQIPVQEWIELYEKSESLSYYEAMRKWYKLSCKKLFL